MHLLGQGFRVAHRGRAQRKNPFLDQMGSRKVSIGVDGLGSQFLFDPYKRVVGGGAVSTEFAASRTVFIPKSKTVDDNGLIARPLMHYVR